MLIPTQRTWFFRFTDGKDSYASSSVLGEASPVFAGLSTVPHPPVENAGVDDYIDDKPVMKVHEDGRAVLTLLQCCYPALTPPIDTLWDVFDVCLCGDKFGVEKAKQLGKEALKGRAAGKESFAVYPVAWRFGFMDIATDIAKNAGWDSTFTIQMRHINYGYRYIYKIVDGEALQALCNYNTLCHNVVVRLCYASEWIDRERADWQPFWSKESTQCCPESVLRVIEYSRDDLDGEIDGPPAPEDDGEPWRVKRWFLAFLRELGDRLSHKSIRGELATMGAALQASSATGSMCPKCRETFEDSFEQFKQKFCDIARQRVNNVCHQCCSEIRLNSLHDHCYRRLLFTPLTQVGSRQTRTPGVFTLNSMIWRAR